MPRFAANLSMLYPELPFMARFEAAKNDGFEAVEYLFPYAFPAHELAAALKANALQQVLFNAPPGGADPVTCAQAWDAGERGLACLPGREADFQFGVQLALDYAQALHCPRIHVMAGLASIDTDPAQLRTTYVNNLRWAARLAAQQGVEVLIEPINPRDMPRYFLNRQDHAHEIVQEVGAPNLKVQMDLYHCQVVEGDLSRKLRQYLPTGRVTHIQVAGVPERHEPDQGEVNYPYLFALLDELGYTGWVGCEYRPRLGAVTGGTTQGLGWRPHRE
ncbi:2-oxo-tetronate isomerase [Rhodoferax sp. PAMC 29310]|uniref:2-oxo-tetronate isomerase n=1 Tax=Rhodoferax sp. PAMC 29310 TaxID=2822760 RepID=UPI001B32D4DD|nr:2-oxo-tetronate isomerase [Rhodoferax sp. PAMC 29310]